MNEPQVAPDQPSGAVRPGPDRLGSRGLQIGALALAAVLALVIAAIVGRTTAGTHSPGDSSAAAGFARDMTDHHAQAVDMATIIGQRTTSRTSAAWPRTSRSPRPTRWVRCRAGSTSGACPWDAADAPMAWMDSSTGMDMSHSSTATRPAIDAALMRPLPDGRMPGMATNAEINQLRTLPVAQADVLFLQLMIAHHRAGIAMAQMAEALTREPVVDRLAATMVSGQQGEITQMTQMLQARGATP